MKFQQTETVAEAIGAFVGLCLCVLAIYGAMVVL